MKLSYGIEQFLHGPKVTLDNETSIIAFTSLSQDRQDNLIKYANVIEAELIEINDYRQSFTSSSKEFGWLNQLIWGQQNSYQLVPISTITDITIQQLSVLLLLALRQQHMTFRDSSRAPKLQLPVNEVISW